MAKYRYGKVTFGCFLAKEHWITELNIRSLSHILTYGNVSGPDKSHLKSILKSLISSEKE